MTPCIGYFSYYCDQVPNKKELKGRGGVCLCLQFQGTALIIFRKACQQEHGAGVHTSSMVRNQRASRKLGKVINLKTSPHWVISFARFHLLKVPQPFQRASPTGSQPGTLHLYLLPNCCIPWARSSSRWGRTEVWGPLGRVEDKLPYIHCFLSASPRVCHALTTGCEIKSSPAHLLLLSRGVFFFSYLDVLF